MGRGEKRQGAIKKQHKELKRLLEGKEEINVRLHPGLAEQYRRREVTHFDVSLNQTERRQEGAHPTSCTSAREKSRTELLVAEARHRLASLFTQESRGFIRISR